MILRMDHVSLAVKDVEKARAFFCEVFGAVPGVGFADDAMKYEWKIFSLGDLSRIELINSTGPGSFLDNFLKDKKAGGVHHITLQTPDIRKAMARLDALGVPYFGQHEYADAYWKEIFIHPRDAFGVLIQISEFEADDWLAPSEKFPPGQKWSAEKTGTGASLRFAHPGGGKARVDLTKDEIEALIRDLRTLTDGSS